MGLDVDLEIKIALLFGLVVNFIFGIIYFVATEWWVIATGWPFFDPTAGMLVGSFLLAMGVGNLKAWKDGDWDKQENIIILNFVWCLLGSISMIVGYVLYALPVGALINLILLLFFTAIDAHILIQKLK